ncbi:MAG TPA: YbdK family carboxylate-amine ligase, partial [Capillimicrobium sp.]
LVPDSWVLAGAIDEVLPRLPPEVRASAETQSSALEYATDVHERIDTALADLRRLRRAVKRTTDECGLGVAAAGTHPFAVWREVAVTAGARQEAVYGSMRELARREPTFALHVHVGVPGPEEAVRVFNAMRVHAPVLLALSANSPFWQGRDTGLASARTPLFQGFPRVGVPRAFADYAQWVEAVDLLVRCEAFPDPSFLWWDLRLRPEIGTVEIRVMDVQTTIDRSVGLAALAQSLVRLEALEGHAPRTAIDAQEVLEENRFLAARDGVDARLIDPVGECRPPLRESLPRLVDACRPHAQDLGCEAELETVSELLASPGNTVQLRIAEECGDGLRGLVGQLAAAY